MSQGLSKVQRLSKVVASVLLAASMLVAGSASAHDVPNQIIMYAFVKPEGHRLHLLVRIPLIMLANLNLPKRGPGYLDLAQIDAALQRAVSVTAKEIEIYEDGTRLTSVRSVARISQPSDQSFEIYGEALAHIEGPKLPESTNVFWNQGFFDAHLEYPIRSDQSDFSLDNRVAPGLSGRLKMMIWFLPPDGATRAYVVHAGFGRVMLDPRWHQAAWLFMKSGFFRIFSGIDHLLFLFCLVIPFRYGRLKRLIPVVISFTAAHSITLIGSAYGLGPSGEWFPPLIGTLIAASIVYMALENIVVANLRRRWLIASVFGLVHGFGLSYGLQHIFQFAGDHLLLSLLSFNIGVEVGQILVLLVALPAFHLLFRYLVDERLGVVILSVLLAHTAWHWMLDRAEKLRYVQWLVLDAASTVTLARWALFVLLVGWAVGLLLRQYKQVRLLLRQFEHPPAAQKPHTEEDLA